MSLGSFAALSGSSASMLARSPAVTDKKDTAWMTVPGADAKNGLRNSPKLHRFSYLQRTGILSHRSTVLFARLHTCLKDLEQVRFLVGGLDIVDDLVTHCP